MWRSIAVLSVLSKKIAYVIGSPKVDDFRIFLSDLLAASLAEFQTCLRFLLRRS